MINTLYGYSTKALLSTNARIGLMSILVGLFALSFYIVLLPSDITWISVGSDGADYMIAAKYLRIAHPTGEPLYIMAGAVFMRVIPFGSEWWRFALMSSVFTAATAGVLYYATRSYFAPLIYMASAVVISQSTIVELYSMVTFFIVLGWVLHSQGQRGWGYAVIGLGLAVHHLAGFVFLGLVLQDFLRKESLKPALMAILVGAPWYLYIPFANREPYISMAGGELMDYVKYFSSQSFLWGGMALLDPASNFIGKTLAEDAKLRFWDVTRIILSLGPVLLILIPAMRERLKAKDTLLPLLLILITLYYATNLDARVYTYMVIPTALAAILVGNYAHKLSRWPRIATGSFLATMLAIGIVSFSTVDPYHSAESFRQDLAMLPPDATIWSYNRGWEQMTAVLYNFDHGTHFNTVNLRNERGAAADTWALLQKAEADGKLYRTYIVDSRSYLVDLEPTTAERVMREIPMIDLTQRDEYTAFLESN